MRSFLLLALTIVTTAGCGAVYKQPMYQGNLIRETAVQQLQVGQSRQQVSTLLGTPSIMDPFNSDRWDYTGSRRNNRAGKTETTNFIVHFENDRVSRWEGDYLAVNDGELAMKTVQQFGRNLARDKKKRR